MEYPDYSDVELFLEDQEPEWTRLLERSQQRHEQRLEDELDRIDDQLQQRDKIHEDAIEELKSKLDWYKQRLKDLYHHSFGQQEKKQRLKNQIDRFYKELRTEKRQHWRDIQELESERRQLLVEIDEHDDTNSWFKTLYD
ncbi:calcium binding protein [Haloferax gibbonsii ATCC 33959]|uniref:Calcium binding protein n=1 Tax=Haloferax gibbonsii (strain ATCC 33959 / DSM 4427 / JCM 8863 / NBRC 102184 / NCIMB 2188 / Ma 2.38) TaxID=1227459 RepID=M0H6L7_HALGM|nr:hypothetical protein [Haloferax gibbonsii]ELZ80156.1 calcium binding protein [Haloferax gibbonsii ATCC 33959]